MATEQPLVYFEKRPKIYPRSIKGRFRDIKTAILGLAYAVFFLLPFVRWDRGPGFPDQAVLFDLPGRAFYIFGLTVWPQEIFWLAILLLFAAVLLFFVTGMAGRVWCGYFCFQTLWTDLFFMIERWIEGERPARMRLDKEPLSVHKIGLKVTKHLLWMLVAFATAFAFTAYFTDSLQLARDFFVLEAAVPAYVTILILSVTTYTMAGLMKEQVCTTFCPYGRFQSVMFDENTMIVAYDKARGEGAKGRHKPQKGVTHEQRQAAGYGDCIDCGLCVQVCPTGIDIRNGLQYQCISCALCIDACDTIMDSMHWPRGLIRYSSENELEHKPTKRWTPKNIAYAAVLSLAVLVFGYSMATRSHMVVDVQQERQPLYVQLSDGRIQNKYIVKVTNKQAQPAAYRIQMAGLPQAELQVNQEQLAVAPGKTAKVNVFVRVPPQALHEEKQHFEFKITDLSGREEKIYTIDFYAPESLVRDK